MASRVATVSLATSRQWRGADGQRQEKTAWHRVICWNTKSGNGQQLADLVERYCKKGDKLYVEGRDRVPHLAGQGRPDAVLHRDHRARCDPPLGSRRRGRRWWVERIALAGGGRRRCGQVGSGADRHVARGGPRSPRRRGRRPAVLSEPCQSRGRMREGRPGHRLRAPPRRAPTRPVVPASPGAMVRTILDGQIIIRRLARFMVLIRHPRHRREVLACAQP